MSFLHLKKIPNTSYQNYISGLEALNIKTDLHDPVDWHRLGVLYSNIPNDIIQTFNENTILGNKGIIKQKILLTNEDAFVATPTRALVDLIFRIISSNDSNKDRNLQLLSGDIYNYFPSTKDRNNIASLLIQLINKNNDNQLIDFFKQEMPKEFYKYKYEGENYEYSE